jgi:trans-aconitate 2-methyltransferase
MAVDDPTSWDPDQYRQFAEQRAEPFHDLLAMLHPAHVQRAVDLGCGPGELTALVARQLGVGDMVGIDNSASMLEAAAAHVAPGVRFEFGDIAAWTSDRDVDLALAAASLHWVPDHPTVIARWTEGLAPGGQLAVQVPANSHAPTHTVAIDLAEREPYRSVFGPAGPPADPVAANVLRPDAYARLLHDLGYVDIDVQLRVYPHLLPTSRHAVEWVKGTMLTRFRDALPADVYDRFLDDYSRSLRDALGDEAPCFFPFSRILFVGRRPG